MKLPVLVLSTLFTFNSFANNCDVVVEEVQNFRAKELHVDPYIWVLDNQETTKDLLESLDVDHGFNIIETKQGNSARFVITDYYKACTTYSKEDPDKCLRATGAVTFFDQHNKKSFTYIARDEKGWFFQASKDAAFEKVLQQLPNCGTHGNDPSSKEDVYDDEPIFTITIG